MVKKIGPLLHGRLILLITCMITDQIRLRSDWFFKYLQAHIKLKDFNSAIEDCNQAIKARGFDFFYIRLNAI